jgi:clan AA aspartic protease
MIRGTIRNREAIIELGVAGLGQPAVQIEAVIDTGYNGYLTLPDDLVTALQLPFAGHRRGRLADGSVTRLDVYLASVVWHGRQKDVLISQADGTPLIGMALLEGSRLTMDVIDDGDVSIEALPHTPALAD